MKPVKSFREQMAENRKSERAWAAATQGIFGKDRAGPSEPAARLPRKKSEVQLPHRTEADVLRDCLSLLHRHPKVAIVERHNSGAADFNGRHVKFNRVRIQGVRGALISDITGTLKSGRQYAIECKAPDWIEPTWDWAMKDGFPSAKFARELGQKAYLDAIVKAGGIGMFITDVLQLVDALEDI